MQLSKLFWSSTVDELKQGYTLDENKEVYVCLICGRHFEKGLVYPSDGLWYEAERFTKKHIQDEHESVFSFLLQLNRKYTGITDLQKQLLELFNQGLTDQEIAKAVGGNSPSTIRNHRFSLRERKKQAKVFLAIMELFEEGKTKMPDFVDVHRSAAMVDERFAITQEEHEKFIATYFPEGPHGPLSQFPKKEKRKVAILRHISKRFDQGTRYSEKQVNRVLQSVYDDYVTIRRYLIEYGFLDRDRDGSAYWVKM